MRGRREVWLEEQQMIGGRVSRERWSFSTILHSGAFGMRVTVYYELLFHYEAAYCQLIVASKGLNLFFDDGF